MSISWDTEEFGQTLGNGKFQVDLKIASINCFELIGLVQTLN